MGFALIYGVSVDDTNFKLQRLGLLRNWFILPWNIRKDRLPPMHFQNKLAAQHLSGTEIAVN